jgi:hypothetical protein
MMTHSIDSIHFLPLDPPWAFREAAPQWYERAPEPGQYPRPASAYRDLYSADAPCTRNLEYIGSIPSQRPPMTTCTTGPNHWYNVAHWSNPENKAQCGPDTKCPVNTMCDFRFQNGTGRCVIPNLLGLST